MLTVKNYVRVQSLQEAYELNQKKTNCIIGGMMWLRMGSRNVQTLIDLSDLHLDTIEETEEEYSIGAMVSLRQLELHESLNRYTNGAAAASVRDIVGVQFRNTATVGGSIFGRFGFSDVFTMFLAMDAYVELFQAGRIPIAEFAKRKRDRDVLVRLVIKKRPGAFAYQAMRNARTDFPVLTCAVSRMDGAYCAAIGARPGLAVLVKDDNGLLSAGVTDEAAERFADYVAANVRTDSNLRGSAAYRKHLVRVLTARALKELGGDGCGNND